MKHYTAFNKGDYLLIIQIQFHSAASGTVASCRLLFHELRISRGQDQGAIEKELKIGDYSIPTVCTDAVLKGLISDLWKFALDAPLSIEWLLFMGLFYQLSDNMIEHIASSNNEHNSLPYLVDCGGMKAALRGAAAHYVDRWIAANGK